MFTLKFYRIDGSKANTTICCHRYDVIHSPLCTAIHAYPTIKQDNPEWFQLAIDDSPDGVSYFEVFVENIAGKTIDRYRAPPKVEQIDTKVA